MIRSRALSAALLLILPALPTGCSRRADPSTYHVLVVTLDTTRADRIGAFGGTAVPTPNLDAAAESGTRFTQTISTNPLTLPAHTSMFTGRYPFRHGVRHNGAYKVPASEVTLAERLQEAGFRTGAFVAAFVLDKTFGLDQGFETYSGVASNTAATDFLRPSLLQRPAEAVNESFFGWLDGLDGARFFAWVHYYDPHAPYAPPEHPGVDLSGSGYDREISYVDHRFGQLIEGLRRRGVLDRTILVVIGDHGECLGSHGEYTHGIFLYEPALHVPFLVRAPGLVEASREVGSPVSISDVAPTVLSLLGLPALEGADGRALLSADRRPSEDRARRVYAETWMPRVELGWSDLSMLRGERYKFVQAPRRELYDLASDPTEGNNLADVERDVADEMEAALRELQAEPGGPRADASHALSPEEIALLQSLGYLRGGADPDRPASAAPLDPKDHVEEVVALERAEEALAAGNLVDAEAGFERVLAKNPRNPAAWLLRARTLLRRGDTRAAEDAAASALASVAADPLAPASMADNARGLLATLASLDGRFREADEILRTVSGAKPRDSARTSPVSLLFAGVKNRDDAEAIVRVATERRPRDPWSWATALELGRRVSDSARVRAALERLERLGSDAVPALVDLGVTAQRSENLDLAIELFETALRLRPDHPDLLGYLATAHLAAGDLDDADRLFERVSRIRPDDPRAPMYRANVALLRGDERQARAMIAETLKRDARFVPVLLGYARWLADHDRSQEAITVVRDALARRPGDPDAAAMLRSLEGRPRAG